MLSFFEALASPHYSFLRNAIIAGALSSILFGVLGAVITVRRIAALAGGISHAALGGIGMALFFSAHGILPGVSPQTGALVFAILAALAIGFVSLKARQREDTVIQAIWAIGMSAGVLFMAKTPGYTDPSSYLFGNILLVSQGDLRLLAALDAIVLFLAWKFYPQLEASSFDEEFARARGINTNLFFIGILIVTALSVVLLQTFVGIVMVVAMLTLPAGIASFTAKNLFQMMAAATILSALFSFAGLVLGWGLDAPAGAMTVVTAGGVFLAAAAANLLVKKAAKTKGSA